MLSRNCPPCLFCYCCFYEATLCLRKLILILFFSGSYKIAALHQSASYGHLEVCRLLVEAKADVAARHRSQNKTALTLAIDGNKADVVAYLRSIGAPQ